MAEDNTPDADGFQNALSNLRFGAFIIGLILAMFGFGVAVGWSGAVGVLGLLLAIGALIEKSDQT